MLQSPTPSSTTDMSTKKTLSRDNYMFQKSIWGKYLQVFDNVFVGFWTVDGFCVVYLDKRNCKAPKTLSILEIRACRFCVIWGEGREWLLMKGRYSPVKENRKARRRCGSKKPYTQCICVIIERGKKEGVLPELAQGWWCKVTTGEGGVVGSW